MTYLSRQPIRNLPVIKSLLWLALTLLLAAPLHAADQLTAEVDRSNVGLEETLKLTVRINKHVVFGEPDFSELEKQFDILGRHRGNQYRSVNGVAESWTQWSLTLAPKKKGKLLIPSFQFEGVYSNAIEINVDSDSGNTPATGGKSVFMEAELGDTSVYVQQQLLLTVRLFTRVDLASVNNEELELDNALVMQVKENQYQRSLAGVRYGVVEVVYAIFPQQSGPLQIPPLTWTVVQQPSRSSRWDPFLSGGGQRLRLRTEPLTVNVKAKPSQYTGSDWLPAEQFNIAASWSGDQDNIRVGEPITRNIELRAQGLTVAQIPPLQLEAISNAKFYPDQPITEENLSANGIEALKTESYAVVPTQAGKMELPAIEITWWDTQADRERQAILPAETIVVLPATSLPFDPRFNNQTNPPVTITTPTENDQTAPASNFTSSLWFYFTLLLALTNLGTVILWLQARSGKQTTTMGVDNESATSSISEKQAFAELKRALKNCDPQSRSDLVMVRSAILVWARLRYQRPDLSLHDFAECEPETKTLLDGLQRSLYGQQGQSFEPAELYTLLNSLRAVKRQSGPNGVDLELPPLYRA